MTAKIKPVRIFIDQYNMVHTADNYLHLKHKYAIPGKMTPMYVDRKDGRTLRIGIVIGQHWFTEVAVVEKEAGYDHSQV